MSAKTAPTSKATPARHVHAPRSPKRCPAPPPSRDVFPHRAPILLMRGPRPTCVLTSAATARTYAGIAAPSALALSPWQREAVAASSCWSLCSWRWRAVRGTTARPRPVPPRRSLFRPQPTVDREATGLGKALPALPVARYRRDVSSPVSGNRPPGPSKRVSHEVFPRRAGRRFLSSRVSE